MTSGGLIHAEFFTTTHRMIGKVETGLKPLSDLLNDRSQSYLLLFDVQVSHFTGEIYTQVPVAYLSKENLNFVIVASRETRAPDRSRYTVHLYQALAILPRFEVQGKFSGPHRLDLRTFSPATLDSFMVLTEATARVAAMPEVTFTGEAILVNRARLECLCLSE